MLVIAKNFIRRSRIERRQGINSPQEFFYLLRQNSTATTRLQSLQTFLERLLNGFRDRLARFACHQASEVFGLGILYA